MIINTLQVVHNYNWESIEAEESIIELPDVVKNLSTDTKNCYRLIKATTTEKLMEELVTIKCGPLCQSRWLSTVTGKALLMLWMGYHKLEGEVLRRLRMLITFCVHVYFKQFSNTMLNIIKLLVQIMFWRV